MQAKRRPRRRRSRERCSRPPSRRAATSPACSASSIARRTRRGPRGSAPRFCDGLDAGLPAPGAARARRPRWRARRRRRRASRVEHARRPRHPVGRPRRDAAGGAVGADRAGGWYPMRLRRSRRAVVAKLDWTGKPAPAGPAVPPLTADEQKRFDAGREVFTNLCAGCHQADGQGKEKVGAEPRDLEVRAGRIRRSLIRILVGGKEGPVGLMPPLGRRALGRADRRGADLHSPRMGPHRLAGGRDRRARDCDSRRRSARRRGPRPSCLACWPAARGRGGGN